MNKPDLIDVVHAWARESYPHFSYEIFVLREEDPSNHKVLIIHSSPFHRGSHVLSMSIDGHCWHRSDPLPHFSIDLNPADPNFFKILTDIINGVYDENR